MRILTFLLLMVVGAGQMWANTAEPSNIKRGTINGGSVAFYADEACTTSFNGDVEANATVYVKATADPGYTAIGVTFTVKKSINSNDVQAPRRRSTPEGPGMTSDITVSAVTGKPDIYQFTMPADGNTNVSVDATFAAPQQQQVSYVDENGASQTVNAYVMDETMLGLSTGFYIAPDGGITFSNSFTIADNASLILKDGATMTVNGTLSATGNQSLTIYAQTAMTGQLTVTTYACGVILVPHFVAYSGDYATALVASGTVSDVNVTTINGKTLKPLADNAFTKYVPQDKSGSYTMTLPALPDGASYTFTKTDASGVINSYSYDAVNNTLTFTTNSGTTGGTTATITVAATGATNNNDYSFTLNVTVSEYTTAYAWPKQTNIYLIGTDLEKGAETAQALHKNELVWSADGVILDRSLLTVKKNGTAVTDYTTKVGETVLTAGENTLVLEPGAYRINITDDDGKLDDWVDFKVIKLIENDPNFKIIAEDGPAHPRLDGTHQDDFPTTVPVTVTYQGVDVTDNDNTTYWLKHGYNNPGKIYHYSELYKNNPDYNSPLIYPSTFGGTHTTFMAGVDGEKYAVYNLGTGNTVAYNEVYCIDKIVGQRIWHRVGEEIKTLRDDEGNPVSSGVEGGHVYYVGDYCPNFYLKDGRVYLGDVQMAEYDPEYDPYAVPGVEGVYVDEYLTIDPNHILHDGKDIFYLEGSAIYKYSNFYDLGGTTIFRVPGSTDCHSLRDGDVESFSQNGTTITINGKSFQLGERIILGQTFISTGSAFISTGDNVPTVDAQNENIIHVGDYQINAQGRIIFCAYSLSGTDTGTSKGYWPYCAYVKYRLEDYCYLIGRDDFLAYPVESGVRFEYDQEHNVGGTPVFTTEEEVLITVKTFGYPSEVYEGEDKYGSTGDLYIFLNDEQYGEPHPFNPSCSHDISFGELSEGTYVVRAELDKDERHLKSTGIFTFKVVRNDPVLTLTGSQNTAGEAFKDGANIEYDPENLIVVNAVNKETVSKTYWRWTISDPTVVTKNKVVKSEENEPNSEDIYLNTVGIGTVTLKARFSGNDLYNPAKEDITFTVVPKNVTSPIIKLVSDETIYYDGQEKKPEVKVYYAEDKLIPTDQYTVTYDNNINASSTDSKAKIIVKSKTGALYTIDAEEEFIIQETAVTITELPTASVTSAGKTVAASTLSGGKAKAGELDVEGTFSWKNGTVVLTVDDSNVTEYDVTFTPDNKNFKTGDCKVTLTVMPRAMLFAENSTNFWATFCGQNDYELPEGCTAYTISGISGSTVTLSKVTAEENALVIMPAYTPMLIQRTEGNLSDNITAAFNAVVTAPASGYDALTGLAWIGGSNFAFFGNATDVAITANAASCNTEGGFIHVGHDDTGIASYVLRNGQFILVDENQGLAAHRCVLNVSTQTEWTAPRMLSINSDVTGVKEVVKLGVESGVKKDDSWYSLDGRKLNAAPTQKGVYINGGRKVVVK